MQDGATGTGTGNGQTGHTYVNVEGRPAANIRQNLIRATSVTDAPQVSTQRINQECRIQRAKRRAVTFGIRVPEDHPSVICDITGVEIAESGTVLTMTDFSQAKVKLFDAESHTIKVVIPLSGRHLWDVAYFATYDAIVTSLASNCNTAHIINTCNKSSRLVTLETSPKSTYQCLGVCFNKGIMYSTTIKNGVLHLPGQIRANKSLVDSTMKVAQAELSVGCELKYPAYIKVNTFGRLFVSDMDSMCVIVIHEGACRYTHTTHPTKPCGLSEYKDGSMLVAIQSEDSEAGQVCVISADGAVLKPFLSGKALGGQPNNICYNRFRDELVVVYSNKDQSRIFYLE